MRKRLGAAPPPAPPPAAARLGWRQSGRRRTAPPLARGPARGGEGARGPPGEVRARGCYRPPSAPGPETGKPQAEGAGREGGSGRGNFPPFSFIPPSEGNQSRGRSGNLSAFCPVRGGRGGCVPTVVSQTLSSDSLATPAQTLILSPNSCGSLRSPCRVAAHRQPELSLGHRAAAPGEGGPCCPYLRGQHGARAPGRSPAPASLQPRPHSSILSTPPAPLAGSQQRVGK